MRRRHPLSETQAWPGFADGDDVPGLGPRFDAFDDDAMEADLPGSRAHQLPLAIDKLPPASQVARPASASRHRLGLRAPTSYVTHACLPHLQERMALFDADNRKINDVAMQRIPFWVKLPRGGRYAAALYLAI